MCLLLSGYQQHHHPIMRIDCSTFSDLEGTRITNFEYTYIIEKLLVYVSLQRDATIIDSAEQQFQCAKVDVLNLSQKKKYSEYHFSTYVCLHRKVDLLLSTEKCCLSIVDSGESSQLPLHYICILKDYQLMNMFGDNVMKIQYDCKQCIKH